MRTNPTQAVAGPGPARRWLCAGRIKPGVAARLFCVAGWCGVFPVVGGALNLTMQHRAVLSNEPSTDADGSRLTALFEQAEDYYEGLIEDGHDLEVQFYYFDYGSQTQNLGGTNLITQSGGRATKVYIQIAKNPAGSPSNWYYDPSPGDHGEFDLQRTLAQDLSSSERSDYFNGSVPDTLELGYTGYGSGGAAGKYDLYTLVLHEVGHALGLHSENTSTISETGDGDYDFNSSQLGGYHGAVEIESGQVSHLDAPTTLMAPYFSPGERRLPSTTDLLAMAKTHNYNQLDLGRVDFAADGGSNVWTGSNWIGGRSPDSGDDAFIGSADFNPTVGLSSDRTVRNLTVSRGDNLDLNNRRLTVTGMLKLRDGGTEVLVRGGSGAVLTTPRVDAGSSVQIELRDGGRIDADTLDLASGATLFTGAGQVVVQDRLNNLGEIRGLHGGTTVFTTNGMQAAWDLDGDGGGTVNVAAADLTFSNGRFTDDFGGTLLVREGRTLTVPETLTVDGGFTEFSGSSSVGGLEARLSGGDLHFQAGTMRWQGNVRIDQAFTMTGGTLESDPGQEHRATVVGDASFLGGSVATTEQHTLATDGNLLIDGVAVSGPTRFEAGRDATLRGSVSLGSVLAEQTLRVEGNVAASLGVATGPSGELRLVDGAALFAESYGVGTIEIGDGLGSAALTWGAGAPGADATIYLDINGAAVGEHDQVSDYQGAIGLGRDATLVLRTGYTPQLGDQVTLIEGFDDPAGVPFAATQGTGLDGGLRWALTYGTSSVGATVARPGDTDLDGDVDFRDAMVLRRGYEASAQATGSAGQGTLTPPLVWDDGDFDHDGDVDLDDALALTGNYTGRAPTPPALFAPVGTTAEIWVDVTTGETVLADIEASVSAIRLFSGSGSIETGVDGRGVLPLRSDANAYEAVRLSGGLWTPGRIDPSGPRDLRFWFAGFGDESLRPGVVRYVPEPASAWLSVGACLAASCRRLRREP